ncbi:hypothetical protein RI129_005922 [Pyrocoelia pectoralis]|uniref:Ionotropic glutamate receptor C-terminal domain-containing protein n=1 Tax=Pyrocoelia pectoralis TaxID=417401 RepID=A0AAN7VBK2_9COLE
MPPSVVLDVQPTIGTRSHGLTAKQSMRGHMHGPAVVTDSVKLWKTLSSNGVLASFHPILVEVPQFPVLVVIDLDCNYSLKLLTMVNKEMFAFPYRWLLISTNESSTMISTVFAMNIVLNSDVVLARHAEAGNYTLTKIYRLEPNLEIIQEKFGYWEDRSGLVLVSKRSGRRNLSKITLNTCLVVTVNDSLLHLTDKRERHIDTISKVSYALLLHLGDILNATLKYSVQNTWGYQGNQSDWNGMIGELQRGEAVIGGTVLFLRSDRIPVIDYVGMTIPTRSKFVFKQPKLSYVVNVYALPFNWTVWLSLLFMVLFIVTTLYEAIKWNNCTKENMRKRNYFESKPVLLDIIFLAFGAVCQQGSTFTPSNASGRIITILMFTSLMFLYTAYSANIVALLQSSSNNIRTLTDLLNSRLSVGVDDTVFNRFYFPHATEPVRKALYQQKVAPLRQSPRYFSIRDGIEMMRNDHFAFHMETGVGYQFVLQTFQEHEKCGLTEIQFLQVSDPALALQKNTPYKKLIQIGLRKIHESGLQMREVSLLYTKKPICLNKASSFVNVGLVDCYLASAILLIGVILSLAIFLFEIILSKQ